MAGKRRRKRKEAGQRDAGQLFPYISPFLLKTFERGEKKLFSLSAGSCV